MKYIKFVSFIFLLLISKFLFAATTVEVVWPFSAASSTTNYIRLVIEQANKSQNEYNFILVHKPGAGGVVASSYVLNSQTLAVLATSNAFFVRPYLYPDQTYNFKSFKPLIVMGKMPMAFIGKTGVEWNRITSKDQIFIGIPGLGSFSHILAHHFLDQNRNTIIVPYQGTTEALKDVGNGTLDLSLDVPSMVLSNPTLYNLYYITGTNSYNNKFKLASKFINPIFNDLVLEFAIMVPSETNPKLFTQLRSVLSDAHDNNLKLKKLYKDEWVTPISKDPDSWYEHNIHQWKKFTSNVNVK
jgi:hypothetical protein